MCDTKAKLGGKRESEVNKDGVKQVRYVPQFCVLREKTDEIAIAHSLRHQTGSPSGTISRLEVDEVIDKISLSRLDQGRVKTPAVTETTGHDPATERELNPCVSICKLLHTV